MQIWTPKLSCLELEVVEFKIPLERLFYQQKFFSGKFPTFDCAVYKLSFVLTCKKFLRNQEKKMGKNLWKILYIIFKDYFACICKPCFWELFEITYLPTFWSIWCFGRTNKHTCEPWYHSRSQGIGYSTRFLPNFPLSPKQWMEFLWASNELLHMCL